MYTGMLWFDNDPRTTLTVKVQKAADYYKQKYGRLPDLCLVHPSMLGNQLPSPVEDQGKPITVRAYRPVLPGHLWIGTEEQAS